MIDSVNNSPSRVVSLGASRIAHKAQQVFNRAIRIGQIQKKPCAICGSNTRIHGHHEDYQKPLDVIWLCTKCHLRGHWSKGIVYVREMGQKKKKVKTNKIWRNAKRRTMLKKQIAIFRANFNALRDRK